MINRIKLVEQEPHKIAKFKSKYGVSNRQMALLLGVSPMEVRTHVERDSFSNEHNELVGRIEGIIEHMIEESELLGDHAPRLAVVEHELEKSQKLVGRLSENNSRLAGDLMQFANMTLWEKILFIFRPEKIMAKIRTIINQ